MAKDKKYNSFWQWLDGDHDILAGLADIDEVEDDSRGELKAAEKRASREAASLPGTERVIRTESRLFRAAYLITALVSCLFLIGVLLFTIARLPRYGVENPEATQVVRRYVEQGVEETGATNIIAGIILDYRAFDTLGESHVLFTALVCVMILLLRDEKNMRTEYEKYYTILDDKTRDISRDSILHGVGSVMVPCILLYGFYILLNGQVSPGGGFSGGAVMGAGLIIFAQSFGIRRVDRFLTRRVFGLIAFAALSFYSFAKGFVFYVGANGLHNPIPKGIPGAILSGGLILPLDIAVGMVVATTMFGFYCLFKRGSIGSD